MEDITNKSQEPDKKLEESVKKFVSAYKALSAKGKAAFQNQINLQFKNMDERTRKLYEALIEAAQKELEIPKAIDFMEKADKKYKSGV